MNDELVGTNRRAHAPWRGSPSSPAEFVVCGVGQPTVGVRRSGLNMRNNNVYNGSRRCVMPTSQDYMTGLYGVKDCDI